jgi:hypothetical protein
LGVDEVAVPKSRLWAWKPEVLDRVAAAMSDPRPNRPINSRDDLNELTRELGVKPGDLDSS